MSVLRVINTMELARRVELMGGSSSVVLGLGTRAWCCFHSGGLMVFSVSKDLQVP